MCIFIRTDTRGARSPLHLHSPPKKKTQYWFFLRIKIPSVRTVGSQKERGSMQSSSLTKLKLQPRKSQAWLACHPALPATETVVVTHASPRFIPRTMQKWPEIVAVVCTGHCSGDEC